MRVPAYTVQRIMRVVCMSEKKRTWNEKWKLVLNELEEKIGTEGTGAGENRKTRGERPERERSLKSKKGRKYETKAEWKRAAFRQEIMLHIVMSAAFLLTTIALIQGIVRVLPDSITVSSTVNGRELPIYCVETDKKQIALSFDAAWGDGYLR